MWSSTLPWRRGLATAGLLSGFLGSCGDGGDPASSVEAIRATTASPPERETSPNHPLWETEEGSSTGASPTDATSLERGESTGNHETRSSNATESDATEAEAAESDAAETTITTECPLHILEHANAGRLVVDIESSERTWVIRFEGAVEERIPREAIAHVEDAPEQWRMEIVCIDGRHLELPRLGDVLAVGPAAIELDPWGTAPLAARLRYTSPVPGRIQVRVRGRRGSSSDFVTPLDTHGFDHEVTVLGLYPDFENTAQVEFTDAQGSLRRSETVTIVTAPLAGALPEFVVEVPYDDPPTNGGFMVDYQPFRQPLFVDVFGDIRYVLLDDPGTKIATQRLQNGNLAHGLRELGEIHEFTWLGERRSTWSVGEGFSGLHHEVLELSTGNFLVPTSESGSSTIEDVIIEIDRESGETVHVWDLRESLPTTRQVLSDDLRDWVHVNGLAYDASADVMLVSSQRHGVIALSRSNTLRWILSPAVGWEEAFVPYLLQLSQGAEPPWGQHAPHWRPNGHLLVFDNGTGRVAGTAESSSRIVEYAITPDPMGGGSAHLVFEYGADRPSLYSPIIGDVDHLEADDHRLMVTGALACVFDNQGPSSSTLFWDSERVEKARLIEVDAQGGVVFEMVVRSTEHLTGSVYRAEKMILDPI